ncbi:MAG TPA: hypothetical protein VET89_02825 [Stellaceae bacterium]|nr:hypothetical protein [Stellaceae bacterium]
MATRRNLRRHLPLAGFGAAMLALAGCAAPVQVAQAPAGPIPPGQARIWFYREYEPSVSRNFANIDLNGARVATVPPFGAAIYRDVAPGHYLISPESMGSDVNQSKEIDLRPGQEVFAKVLADNTWVSGGDLNDYHRDTFYISLIPPEVARAQIALNR